MPEVFWVAFLLLAYTYCGYPMLIAIRAAVAGRGEADGASSDSVPRVTVILAVHNERDRIEERIRNLLAQDYPAGLLELYVTSDGSGDGTDEVVEALTDGRGSLRLVRCTRGGKADAINAAVGQARGDILVFADARQRFAPGTIRALVSAFADPRVGVVSGRLELEQGGAHPEIGIISYWRVESWIRRNESRSGSTIGVTGAVYAARRSGYPRLPSGTLLDDLYAPMHMAFRGWRVAYEPEAVAYDLAPVSLHEEFRRKVRTLTGNYQLLRLLPSVLVPGRNPLFFRFVSHKGLRLASPFLLALLLFTSLLVAGPLYGVAAAVQVGFYATGVMGLILPAARRFGGLRVPAAFLLLQAAAVLALYNSLRGREPVWVSPARTRDGRVA